jgi:leader peptidase (prepilin peptidase) / N-methyltransferase
MFTGDVGNNCLVGGLVILIVHAVLIAVIDFKHFVIPDWLNVSLAIFGFGWLFICTDVSFFWRCLEAIGCGAVLYGIAETFQKLRGNQALGMGDVKFAAAATVWTGAMAFPWLVLIASISALFWVVLQQIVGKRFERLTRVAFGPHLCAGLLATWVLQRTGFL